MPVQDSDGKYVGAHGTKHDNVSSAEATKTRATAGSHTQTQFLGNLLNLVPIALLAGLLSILVLVLVAGIRGAWILSKVFWLYPIVVLIAILAFIFIKKSLRTSIPILNFLLAFVLAAAICFLGFKGANFYYGNTDMHFAAIYSDDFVQALPDGKAPVVYEKRDKKGNVIAELSINEKVKVNGISFDKQEFNITTADGKSGWVERAAFPEDAADMLAITVGLDGIDSNEIGIDRQTERMIEKYLEVKKELIVMDVPTKFYGMSDAILRQSAKVNAKAPLMYVDRNAFKDGGELSDAGVKIVLENILYANDCTLLYLTVTDNTPESKGIRIWPLAESLNVTDWQKSFVVKDLSTNETFPLMQGDYSRSFYYDKIDGGYKSNIVFFFPPFKSKHFSLTHNGVSPLPDDKSKTGYGGILGLMSKLTGQDRASDFYFDYNFPDVRVGNR